MSQFEYVAIPVSLILTFAVARLLSGFPHVAMTGRAYWVHGLWCITAILNLFLFWWAFWNASRVEEWTLGRYLWSLLYPATCYVGATILVPSDASSEQSWHSYYYRIRKPLLATATVGTSSTLGTLALFDAAPVWSPEVAVTLSFIALYVFGYMNASERVQRTIVVLNFVAVVAAYAPLIWQPLPSH